MEREKPGQKERKIQADKEPTEKIQKKRWILKGTQFLKRDSENIIGIEKEPH